MESILIMEMGWNNVHGNAQLPVYVIDEKEVSITAIAERNGFQVLECEVDVKERIQTTFVVNSEKLTKDFYQGFRKQHSAFVKFISGIDDEIDEKHNSNKQWYAGLGPWWSERPSSLSGV